jgi:predicted nuclease of predicted toxin-antitoxin system
MKGWLFDQNLPVRLLFVPGLPVIAAETVAPSATDSRLWEYAKVHELVIVTKDADFSARIIVASPPPWVVHLRFGNLRLREFHAVLSRVWPQIEATVKTHKLVNVFADRVEGVS